MSRLPANPSKPVKRPRRNPLRPIHNSRYKRIVVPMADIEPASDELRLAHPNVTDMQARLAELMLHTGQNVKQLAKSGAFNEAWAYQTMRKSHVADFIRDLGQRVLGWDALTARATMQTLLKAKSTYVRFMAAQDIMDRAGLRADTTAPQRAVAASITINIAPSSVHGSAPSQEGAPVTIDVSKDGP